MPSLNVGDYIEKCIESIINQTLKEIEIICIDAGSDDGTLKILENYANKDNRIRLLHSDMKSYGHQVNLGIDKSIGEYVGIVETDDFIDEKMFEVLYDLTDNGSCDIAKVNFYHFRDTNPPKLKIDDLKSTLVNNEKFTVYDNADILIGHPSIWSAIYKKSFLIDNNIRFIEAPGGGWVDNPFLFETALSAKSIVYCNEPFYYYCESNPNSSSNKFPDVTVPIRRMIDILDVLDKYSCNDVAILYHFYIRMFQHVRDLMISDLGSKKHEVFVYFKEVFNRVDEDIIKKYMSLPNRMVYYKILSSSNENSFSMKILIFGLNFIAKTVKFFDERKYNE